MKRSRTWVSVAGLTLLIAGFALPAAAQVPAPNEGPDPSVDEMPCHQTIDHDVAGQEAPHGGPEGPGSDEPCDEPEGPSTGEEPGSDDASTDEEDVPGAGDDSADEQADDAASDDPDAPAEPTEPGDDSDSGEPGDATQPDQPAEPSQPADPAGPNPDRPAAPEPPLGTPEDASTPDLPPEWSSSVVVDLPAVMYTSGGDAGYRLPHGGLGMTWFIDGTAVIDLVGSGAVQFIAAPGAGVGDDGEPVVAGWYEVSAQALDADVADLVIAAAAAPGFVLRATDGTFAAVTYVVDPRTPVELTVPTPVDGEGTQDLITVPDVAGQVVHDQTGRVLEPGEYPVEAEYVDGTATVELTVRALPGHRLEHEGSILDSTPGRSADHLVQLTFTDEQQEVAHLPAPGPKDSSPALAPEPPSAQDDPAEDEDTGNDTVVAVPAALTVGQYQAPQEEPEPEPDTTAEEELIEASGPRLPGVDATVLMGVLFLGAAGTVLGFGRDTR